MSETNNDFESTIETINIYLIGDEQEIAEGMRLIDDHLREKIVSIIRKRALSARKDDLFDIYQEVLLGIYKIAQEGKYEPDKKNLEGLIYKIASNKAIDWLREKFAQKRKRDTDRDVLIESVAEIIRDSNIHEAWEYANQKEKRKLLLKTIRNLIPKLKHRQRQVAEIIKENFPNVFNIPDIKKQILKLYGEDVTAVAVKRARQEVLSKIKESLDRSGYGDNIND